jgi:hypothetical protein
MLRLAGVLAAGAVLAFGAASSLSSQPTGLPVAIVAESATTITVGWTPPTNIAGYVFKVDGARVSNTWDPSRSSARFGKVPSPPAHDYQVVAVAEGPGGVVTYPAPPPPPTTTSAPPVSSPLWNGDSPGDYGDGWEFGGTFDGTPPLGDRVTAAATLDGLTPPGAAPSVLRVRVAPGDQYGGSSGWRTLGHAWPKGSSTHTFSSGTVAYWVWAQYTPAGYPGDANVYAAPFEIHQSKADYVSVTGPAPLNIVTGSGGALSIRVSGGRDGQRIDYIRQTFPAAAGWNVWTVRYLNGTATSGGFTLWHCTKGTSPASLLDRQGIGTMYDGTVNYPLVGVYRAETGTSTTTLYLAGVREYGDQPSALNWASQLCS